MVSIPTGEAAVSPDRGESSAARRADTGAALPEKARPPRSTRTSHTRASLRWTAAATLPWLWFVLRGTSGWFDGVAILLPALIVVSVIGCASWGWFRRSTEVLPMVISLTVFAYATVIVPTLPDPTEPPQDGVRFMSANLESYWFSDNDFDWYLETHETSVLVASEIQLSHRDDLRSRFSHFVDDVIDEERFRAEPDPDDASYKRFGFPSIGVYSQFPLTELDDTTEIEDGLPGLRLRVDLPAGPVILYALHVPKPALSDGPYQVSFREHRAMADALADAIGSEELPVVVLGDLNMTDRGGSYRSLISADLNDGMLAERAQPTSAKGGWTDLLRLRIDHLLVSDELCTESPRYDSVAFADHVVLSAVVGMCHVE